MNYRGFKSAIQFAQRLGLTFPVVIQAPMAGGITTPQLVAAASNAGALGSFATGYLKTEEVNAGINAIQKITQSPFSVNLFVPPQNINMNREVLKSYQTQLNAFRKDLGMPLQDPDKLPELPVDNTEEIADLLIDLNVKIVSFTFGVLPKKLIEKFKSRDIYLMGTATTLEEAILLKNAGIDAIVGQGHEAGGHRGGFFQQSSIGTLSLIPTLVDRVDSPIIASGGIMDARGAIAAMALGASAIQMGTAFLRLAESGANIVYKSELDKASHTHHDSTEMTTVYSGKPARGIRTNFMEMMGSKEIPDYPIPHYLTQPIRKEALKQSNPNLMSLWCGQGIGIPIKESNVEQFLNKLRHDMNSLMKNFSELNSVSRGM